MKSITEIVDYTEERSNVVKNKDPVSRLYSVSREVDREVLERMKRMRRKECRKFNTSTKDLTNQVWR